MSSGGERLDTKWLRERFQDHFIDELSRELDETPYDLEGELVSSQTLDVRNLPPKAKSSIERLLIRAILAETPPSQVKFEPVGRFIAWSREAFEFFRLNIGNSEFVSIFSSGVNYAVILSPLLTFYGSTLALKAKLENMPELI